MSFRGTDARHKVVWEAAGVVEDEYIRLGRIHELPGLKKTSLFARKPGPNSSEAPKSQKLASWHLGATLFAAIALVGGAALLDSDGANQSKDVAPTATTNPTAPTMSILDRATYLRDDASRDSTAFHLFARTFTDNLPLFEFPFDSPYSANCLNDKPYDTDNGALPLTSSDNPDEIIVTPASGRADQELHLLGAQDHGNLLRPADQRTRQILTDLGCFTTKTATK